MEKISEHTQHFIQQLKRAHTGDQKATNWVINEVYDELKIIAANQRKNSRNSLQTTAIVNEAWLKMAKYGLELKDRNHFLAIAATAMRQILIDEAKSTLRQKRGNNPKMVTFHTIPGADLDVSVLIQLNDALEWLSKKDQRLLDVFQMSYFIGLKKFEIADALGLSERTIRRDWIKACAVLSTRVDLNLM
ncbi:MAG: ECF-type sigma factor [bacterium]